MSVTIFGDGRIEGIPLNKKIEKFTASGSWTVPAGVTYAIAHMKGGGGGTSVNGSAGAGGTSSVAFAGGTVSAAGGPAYDVTPVGTGTQQPIVVVAPAANSGDGSRLNGVDSTNDASMNIIAPSGASIVAGDDVTPAASITVTVGAGGSAGTSGGAGADGYVYIEYYE